MTQIGFPEPCRRRGPAGVRPRALPPGLAAQGSGGARASPWEGSPELEGRGRECQGAPAGPRGARGVAGPGWLRGWTRFNKLVQ